MHLPVNVSIEDMYKPERKNDQEETLCKKHLLQLTNQLFP